MKNKTIENMKKPVEISLEPAETFFFDHLEYQEFKAEDDERRHRFLQDYMVH
jgi:hypothetical protein